MNEKRIVPVNEWRPRVLVIGAIAGALVGLGAAYLLAQTAERTGQPPEISAGDGVRLGVLVMGLLRAVAALGEEG